MKISKGQLESYIEEEEQTTQWPNESVRKQKNGTQSTTWKTKDRVAGTPLKTGDELRCSGRVNSSQNLTTMGYMPSFAEDTNNLKQNTTLSQQCHNLIEHI